MPIQVTCQCGQSLTAKDEFAGKRVKCPKCGGPLLISPSQPVAASANKGLSDLLDDVGIRANVNRCPGCGAELAEEAVLCVMCGFDLRRGHKIKTRVGSAVDFDDEGLGELPVHGNPALDHAERLIARDKLEQQRMSKGAPWWMIMLAFLGVVGFAIGMVSLPQDQVVQNSGMILVGFGSLICFYYSLRIFIAAFQESALHGFLMFTGIYGLYYVFTRWDRVGPFFVLWLVGSALIGFGQLMTVVLVPFFQELIKDKEKEDQAMRHLENRPVAVCYCHDLSRI